ncbi:unnamed protein product, partial [Rotaria magnacalcarata]
KEKLNYSLKATSKIRTRRKPTSLSSAATALETTATANDILPSAVPTSYTNVATILSPSLDDQDDDILSTGDA